MATLVSLQGRGGGRIPMEHGLSQDANQRELQAIFDRVIAECYPHKSRRAAMLALKTNHDAQRLIREETKSYFAARTPATPTSPMVSPHSPGC